MQNNGLKAQKGSICKLESSKNIKSLLLHRLVAKIHTISLVINIKCIKVCYTGTHVALGKRVRACMHYPGNHAYAGNLTLDATAKPKACVSA